VDRREIGFFYVCSSIYIRAKASPYPFKYCCFVQREIKNKVEREVDKKESRKVIV
jgi:hypothetical protein